MERRIGRTIVSVQQADITRATVDAVVNAANTRLYAAAIAAASRSSLRVAEELGCASFAGALEDA